MENLIFGITTIVFCIIGYFIAFKQFIKNNITFSLILIICCGLILRIYASADFYLHEWDERFHALVAKNLIHHSLLPTLYDDPLLPFDYRNWTGNHIWVHKQPIPLWTMAISMSVFGINELALRLPSILLTTIGIALTFSIGKYLFNKKVGMIAAFLYSIHGLIIEITAGRVATDHIDVFFMFFIQLAILFAIKFFQSKKKFYNILCGVSIGLAILSKWLPALIVIPVWILLAQDKAFGIKKIIVNLLVLMFVIAVVAVPWQWYIFSYFPQEAQWESSFNLKHITDVLENHGEPFYYHFDKMRMVYGELIYLPLLWFSYKTLKRIRHLKRLALIIWIFIPFIFFSMVKTKMQAYTLFTAPALFIVTGLFFHYLHVYKNRMYLKWGISLVLFLLIALPIRFSIERIKPFSIMERSPLWTQELKALKKELNKSSRKVAIFNTDHPIETMFYNDCTAYSTIPDSTTLSDIKKKNYRILIRGNKVNNTSQDVGNIIFSWHNIVYREWESD